MGGIDFHYGLKSSDNVERTTAQSISIIPGLSIHSRNAFGTFLKINAESCDFYFNASTLGAEGRKFYELNDMAGFAIKSYNNHFRKTGKADITLLVNHLMLQEDNNAFRDKFVEVLTGLGSKNNCAVPSGETAVMNNLKGMYAGLSSISICTSGSSIDLKDRVLIAHADGVGTKSLVYEEGDFGFIEDAIAMNYNDILIAALGVPEITFATNTMVVGGGFEESFEQVKKELGWICNGKGIDLKVNNHTLIPDFKGVEFDMVLTSVFDERKIPSFKASKGDLLIGVASSGIHSNGLSGARSYAERNLSENERNNFYKKLAVPAIIYDDVFKALEGVDLNWGVHVTGGGFTKLLKVIPSDSSMIIHNSHELKPQDLFFELKKEASNEKMYSYFNCGIGLILGVNKDDADEVIKKINGTSDKADMIGQVSEGKHEILIESMFDDEIITLSE